MTPQTLPIPPRMTIERMNAEMLKLKSFGNVELLNEAKYAPATPPKNARVAQAQAAEDGDHHEQQHEPEEEAGTGEKRAGAALEAHPEEPGRIDRRDAVRAVGEVEPSQAVTVVRDLRQNLAEAER